MMYPLIAISIIGLCLLFNTIYSFRIKAIFPAGTKDKWLSYIEGKSTNYPIIDSTGDKLIQSVINKSPNDEGKLQLIIENELEKLRFKMETPVLALENIVAIAPLLGLTGTVLGIIKIFSGQDPDSLNSIALSSGISEALLTTLVGLLIAVPAMIVFSVSHRAFNRLLVKCEETLLDMLKPIAIFKPE